MTQPLIITLGATLVIALIATSAHKRLPPQVAARWLALTLAAVLAAALPTVVMLGLAFLAHAPLVGSGFLWCAQAVGIHGTVPAWLGLPAIAMTILGVHRVMRLLLEHRSVRVNKGTALHVAHSNKPFAVTLPGKAGQIVVSTALLARLNAAERRVVIAHERAHARHRHDRYLLIAAVAAAAVPPLRAVASRLTFSIERWADEDAASECGDRAFVARTLGRVAVQSSPIGVAAFAGLGVPARMHALFAPPVPPPGHTRMVAIWSAAVGIGACSVYQLRHVERLVAVLCPH